jgi:hypothetical protein
MDHGGWLGATILAVTFGGPLLLGLAGLVRGRPAEPAAPAAPAWDWRLVAHSGLLYTLAFNVTFFIQELFLVLPKAFTPGLRPTLYHNNHNWEGDNPLENLFQGTGALAIFVSGLVFAWLVGRGAGRTPARRLFLIWMAYYGLIQSLPQVAAGALGPGSDTGLAMDYFAMSATAKAVAALISLAAIAAAGLWLTRPLLGIAQDQAALAGAGRRTRFIFNAATLPALLAIPAIILFRIPREVGEVVIPPVAVFLVGIAWIQANAWRVADASASPPAKRALVAPLLAALALLAVFQLVLRPGIAFY